MPQPSFLNNNRYRSYPFRHVEDSSLPHAMLADVNLWLAVATAYRPQQHSVWLAGCTEVSAEVATALGLPAGMAVLLASDCPAIDDQYLLAVFASNAARYTEQPVYQVDAAAFDAARLSQTFELPQLLPLAEGRVTVGDPALLVESAYTAGLHVLEPAKVRNLGTPLPGAARAGKTYVYNQKRTLYSPPTGCEHVLPDAEDDLPEYIALADSPISGDVRFAGGHRTTVRQETQLGRIVVSTLYGNGEKGVACQPIPHEGETFDAYDPSYNPAYYDVKAGGGSGPGGSFVIASDNPDRAPKCDDVLRRINGIDGPAFQLRSFGGVHIDYHPAGHRIFVNVNGSSLETCPEIPADVTPDCINTNAQSIPCGTAGESYPCFPVTASSMPLKVVTDANDPTQFALLLAAEDKCGGNCLWVEEDGRWRLAEYPCTSPGHCEEPDRPPRADEQLTTSCLELIDDADFIVRNAEFSANPPLAAWDHGGNVQVITDDSLLPQQLLPVVMLRGMDDPTRGSWLSQAQLHVHAGRRYKLIGDWAVLAGRLQFRIYSCSYDNEQLLKEWWAEADDKTHVDEVVGEFMATGNLVILQVLLPSSDAAIPAAAWVSRLGLLRID